jgi:hypothetical protein
LLFLQCGFRSCYTTFVQGTRDFRFYWLLVRANRRIPVYMYYESIHAIADNLWTPARIHRFGIDSCGLIKQRFKET